MAPSIYSPLSSDTSYLNIRLIRLQPSDDPTAPICCKIVCYPLVPERSHLYECLSYVWGSPENPETVRIDTAEGYVDFDVTQNLYAALLELRDPLFERVLWIDAICINQTDEEEKAQQVVAMTRIFGLASRVVVWLGEEAEQSALAFEQLRTLAQRQQPVNYHLQGDHADPSHNDSGESSSEFAYETFALLSRAYFRRMWVLQEITAARSVLFKCGQVELQGATFLAGLHGLPQLHDWRLRNRIRGFILLMQRSTFRESLKGQDQLHIDPLLDLVDRFNTHEATDNRDKIYALWGLSTESELTNILRPDYSRSWKSLLENLGTYVFGKEAILSTFDSKQMLYARCLCYDLGTVKPIYDGKMWDMEQQFELTSIRASRPLNHGYTWNLTIKIRSSAEEIREDDIVFFLPQTKNLIFARFESHYVRIVSIMESHSIEILSDDHDSPGRCWKPWQPFLDSLEQESVQVPLLWSWEPDRVEEGQEAWHLMAPHLPNTVSQAHHDAQSFTEMKALSEMAFLHMHLDNYVQASQNLTAIANSYDSDHRPQADETINNHERLEIALRRRSMYNMAKDALFLRRHRTDSLHSTNLLCFHVMIHAGMHVVPKTTADKLAYIDSRSRMLYFSAHAYTEFAAKTISQGVKKHMILDAIRLCGIDWGDIKEQVIRYPEAMKAHGLLNLEGMESPSRDHDPYNTYLCFLLRMSEDDFRLSTTELLEASRTGVNSQNLNQLLKRCGSVVGNLSGIIDALRGRAERVDTLLPTQSSERSGSALGQLLTGNAGRVSITFDALISASMWSSEALAALLDAAKDNRSITPLTLDTLVIEYKRIRPDVVRALAETLETEWCMGEDALLTFFGARYPPERRKYDLIAFLKNERVTINITEPVLEVLLKTAEEDTIKLLVYRKDPTIVDGHNIVAKHTRDDRSLENRMLQNLRPLQKGAEAIEDKQILLTIPPTSRGYIQLLNLIRYRRDEIEITEESVLRLIVQPSSQYSRQWWQHYDEMFGYLLIQHADDKVLNSLIRSTDVLNFIALRGFVPIIELLRRQARCNPPYIEIYSQVAIWGKANRNPRELKSFHGSQTHRELIKNLTLMPAPPQLQQTVLELACLGLEHTEEYDVLWDLLSRSVITAKFAAEFQEIILRQGLEGPRSSSTLSMLFGYEVVSANVVFENAKTPLHLIVEHLTLIGSPEMAENVSIVIRHGGAATIDARDAEGKTPRQIVRDRLRDPTRNNAVLAEVFQLFKDTVLAEIFQLFNDIGTSQ